MPLGQSVKICKLFLFLIVTAAPCFTFSQVVNISGGLQVVAQGNISLVVDNGGIKNDGIFKPGNSTVYFSGASTTAITGTQPINFYNLIFQGTGTKFNAGNAAVIGTLGVQGTTVLDADGVTNDKPFTILSSDTATGRVDVLTTGNIIGNVTVERFINTGLSTGEHLKSWQFLATPTTGQTYFQSWQEGGLTPSGYGTWISGSGIGFDAVAALPSLKYYDEPTGNWTAVTNTSNSLQNKLGYMLFVRGDRTVTLYNASPNNTNMRSKGVLFTPFNPPASVSVPANRFQTFGNPYASRISFNQVYLASTGINDVFYVWDPKLNGTWNFGGYQTISGVTGYIPTAGSSTAYYPAGVPSPFIESGQAVFVKGNGTGGTVNFNENCKAAGSRLTNKGNDNIDYFPVNRQFLFASLFSNMGMIADGNIVAFEDGLGNELNTNDAPKILNTGENFGIARDEKILAVEARNAITVMDTIFYNLKNLKLQSYQFRFAPVNIQSGMAAFLIDRYSNSNIPVSLADSTFIDFSINAEQASAAADRFILVFRLATVLPVQIVRITGKKNTDGSNQVNWKVENELNILKYELERSGDGLNFNSIINKMPLLNNGGAGSYDYRDQVPLDGINFYRIKATSNNGQVQYSKIVKVEAGNIIRGITVFPNPVIDKTITVNFRNQPKGNYTIELSNKLGQVIYTNSFYADQLNFVQTIKPGNILVRGTYQLHITREDGNSLVEQVVVR